MAVKFPQADISKYGTALRGGADFWDNNAGLVADDDFFATGLTAYSLSCTNGSYTLAGQNATFNYVSGASAGAATYRAGSLSQAYYGSSGAITVNNAVGHTAGDFLLMVVDIDRSAANTITWPSGFTQIGLQFNSAPDGATVAIAYKFDSGSEPSTYTVTPSNSYSTQVSISAWTGVDTTTPYTLGTVANSTAYNNPNISMALTGVTALAGDAQLLIGMIDRVFSADTWGVNSVSGFTLLEHYINSWNNQYTFYKEGLSAGSTSTETVVTTGGSSNGAGWAGWQLAIHAAAGSGSINYTLSCDSGSYSLVGQSIALKFNRKLLLNAGSYTLSGSSALLRIAHKLPCNAGSYAQSGLSVNLKLAHKLTCATGSYALTGNAATLNYVAGIGAVNYTLACSSSSYLIIGNSAALKLSRRLGCSTGTYLANGVNTSLKVARRLLLANGSYSLNGSDATFNYVAGLVHYRLLCDVGNYAISGKDIDLHWSAVKQYPLQGIERNYELKGIENISPITQVDVRPITTATTYPLAGIMRDYP